MKSNKIIIGTRGSILALAQAEKVKEMLIKKYDELRENESFCEIEGFEKKSPLEIELKVIVTKGDKDLRDFTKIKGTTQKDLFVKECKNRLAQISHSNYTYFFIFKALKFCSYKFYSYRIK